MMGPAGPAADDRERTTVGDPSGSPRPRSYHPLPWVVLFTLLAAPGSFTYLVDNDGLQNWATVFLSVTLQAIPFLVLGVLVSAALASLVPPSLVARAVPRQTTLSVPVAGLAGAVLPGCECSSVPVAGRLVSAGVPPAAALTFLLAAPAINPVVLVATSVAFPGHPEMVLARFGASLATAMLVGFLAQRLGLTERLLSRIAPGGHGSHAHAFVTTASQDFLRAGGYLVAGAMLVATLQTLVPQSALVSLAGSGFVAVASLALLAVLLSICSEADAFVAAGLPEFSLTARLTFLVVGPMVDLKLIALQGGTFGWPFASRFAPLTFATAISVSVLVGSVLL